MYWAPCVRVDIPIDAPPQYVRWMAAALDPIITVLEASEVTFLNLALSGSALLAFDRHGLRDLIDRIAELAGERRIELMSTAAHGGLLPLMPEDEIERQIVTNDAINRVYFGDGYRAVCLWPTMLAVSQKVAEVCARLQFPSILVDEAAMRVWPAQWAGDRIDSVQNIPGLFALPRSRRATRAFDDGQIRKRHDLDKFVAESRVDAVTYLITADELTPRSSGYRALLSTMDQEPTLRLEQLFNHFPLSRATSLLPCSALTTPEDLGRGLPFAPWFQPGNERHALQWRLMAKLTEALRELHRKGLSALPGTQLLRDEVDRGWRESWWRAASMGHEGLVEQHFAELGAAYDGVRVHIPGSLQNDITELRRGIDQHRTAVKPRPTVEEPVMMH